MAENNIVPIAIESVNRGSVAFTKFITANDTGSNGAHQSGFYLHKSSFPLYFDEPGLRGSNKDKIVKIKWQNDFETESRFIYYGTGSRNEYRLTRFGQGFQFLTEENVGNLLVITKQAEEYYEAYVLSTDDEIEDFLSSIGITTQETNALIPKNNEVDVEDRILLMFNEYISAMASGFPSSIDVADKARQIIMSVNGTSLNDITSNPDKEILNWIDTEYQLFKAIENSRYADIISRPFPNVEDFVQTANTILNRRKSRAGKSLEHHLSQIFTTFQLRFEEQPITEGKKKPDFIFPGAEEYHNFVFDQNKLVFLAAKTTCKDRWRQILNEADRIDVKHLFTLQQGISSNQLKEMSEHNVKLVVPKRYIDAYPIEFREGISTLENFVRYVGTTQQ